MRTLATVEDKDVENSPTSEWVFPVVISFTIGLFVIIVIAVIAVRTHIGQTDRQTDRLVVP